GKTEGTQKSLKKISLRSSSVSSVVKTAPLSPVSGILRSPAFYLLAIGSMCSIAAVGGTNQHLKLFLSLDRGYSQGEAARVISLVLACSIAGRLLMGWLADRMPKKFVMLMIDLLIAAALTGAVAIGLLPSRCVVSSPRLGFSKSV